MVPAGFLPVHKSSPLVPIQPGRDGHCLSHFCIYMTLKKTGESKFLHFVSVYSSQSDHSGRAVWGMNCLRSLEHWDRGFES
jgi:hypothetical protein